MHLVVFSQHLASQCKTYCFPAKFASKIPAKLAPFTVHLFFIFCFNLPWKFHSENSREIYHFFPNFVSENPTKFEFLVHNLSEALKILD